ncbi:MAG TPA: RNA polymerase sigma factor [Actinomycetes bacterium]|nr:RNA polymerase sigma factor [Actinomycetes bacterium]
MDDAYRREWAQVLATTVRVAGDLDIAEECVQEAFVSALAAWDADGVPANTGAWLTTVAKRKALDHLRRASTARSKLPLLIEPEVVDPEDEGDEVSVIPDDRLRLVFTCCHPALSPETQVALTLRLVCGLPTANIAQTFLVSESTMAARITRGKKKIQVARIPFVMPQPEDLEERLDAVLTVIHLFFTAGHTAASGNELVDREVVVRAIELGRQLTALMPGHPEAQGLLALMLLTDARRASRVDAEGELVLLAEQDRSLWDQDAITEGLALERGAMAQDRAAGRFALQAAIAGVHASAPSASMTDWPAIVSLYDQLLVVWPTPVVALNRAAAIAMADGPAAGLEALDDAASSPALRGYHYVPAARADLLRQLGRDAEAAEEYRQALLMVGNDVERRFLQRRLAEVTQF